MMAQLDSDTMDPSQDLVPRVRSNAAELAPNWAAAKQLEAEQQ
jgi:hypothetical protein